MGVFWLTLDERLVACPLNALVNISKIADNQQWEVKRHLMFSTTAIIVLQGYIDNQSVSYRVIE